MPSAVVKINPDLLYNVRRPDQIELRAMTKMKIAAQIEGRITEFEIERVECGIEFWTVHCVYEVETPEQYEWM